MWFWMCTWIMWIGVCAVQIKIFCKSHPRWLLPRGNRRRAPPWEPQVRWSLRALAPYNFATCRLLTASQPRRTVPSSSRCLSTSSQVSCHRCQTRIPLIIIPPRSPLWLRPRPKSFLNFCFVIFLLHLFVLIFYCFLFCSVYQIWKQNQDSEAFGNHCCITYNKN